MSTRSAIIEKTETGYRGIYCHNDGYLSYNGRILFDHYQDAAKVSALIDLGDISSLGERVAPIGEHSFDYSKREEGTTVAYSRDRGEEGTEAVSGATVEDVASNIGHDGYVYVFDPASGWTVRLDYPYSRVMSLLEALTTNADED